MERRVAKHMVIVMPHVRRQFENVDRYEDDPIAESVGSGIVVLQCHKLALDFRARYGDVGHARGETKARCARAAPKF